MRHEEAVFFEIKRFPPLGQLRHINHQNLFVVNPFHPNLRMDGNIEQSLTLSRDIQLSLIRIGYPFNVIAYRMLVSVFADTIDNDTSAQTGFVAERTHGFLQCPEILPAAVVAYIFRAFGFKPVAFIGVIEDFKNLLRRVILNSFHCSELPYAFYLQMYISQEDYFSSI